MLKIVWDDYRRNFNSGLKYYFTSYMVAVHCFLFVVAPISMKQGRMIYYLIIIPMIIAQIMSITYLGTQNRTLFLCPLSKEQRELYFMTSLGIRIGIPMILLGISVGILGCLHQITALESLILIVMMFLYIVSSNICCLSDAKRLPFQTEKVNAKNYYALQILFNIDGFVNMFAIFTEIVNKKPMYWYDGLSIGVMTLIQLEVFWVVKKKYYRPIKQIFTDYDAIR